MRSRAARTGWCSRPRRCRLVCRTNSLVGGKPLTPWDDEEEEEAVVPGATVATVGTAGNGATAENVVTVVDLVAVTVVAGIGVGLAAAMATCGEGMSPRGDFRAAVARVRHRHLRRGTICRLATLMAGPGVRSGLGGRPRRLPVHRGMTPRSEEAMQRVAPAGAGRGKIGHGAGRGDRTGDFSRTTTVEFLV